MGLWQKWHSNQIRDSKYANTIALHNRLLNIIHDIMLQYENIKSAIADETYQDVVGNSTNHGWHRASSLNYTIDQLIHKYVFYSIILLLVIP